MSIVSIYYTGFWAAVKTVPPILCGTLLGFQPPGILRKAVLDFSPGS